jgi:hypothetical protein
MTALITLIDAYTAGVIAARRDYAAHPTAFDGPDSCIACGMAGHGRSLCAACRNVGIRLQRNEGTEIRPDDLDVCARCEGKGIVSTEYEPATGAWLDDDCRACDGTGERMP